MYTLFLPLSSSSCTCVYTDATALLYLFQEAMSYKLNQLQRDLSHSVPVTVLEEANTKYAQLVCKYQALLQQTGMEEEKKDDLYSGGRVRKLAWMDDESALAGAVAGEYAHRGDEHIRCTVHSMLLILILRHDQLTSCVK